MKQDVSSRHIYDAVIVLGNNIRKAKDGYRPTTYSDHDEFGMLAGEMNVIAATLLFEQQVADAFVFSTGTSQKTKAVFGPDVPTEAEVYSKEFLHRIQHIPLAKPDILLEKRSVNTYSNLTECIRIINEQGWKNVAVMSPRYHAPRIQALWNLATERHPVSAAIEILSAEDVIEEQLPGVYDQVIKQAYASEQGQTRLKNEKQGLIDLEEGRYVVTEFQLQTSKQPS